MGGKKIKGRKRHLLVDTQELVLEVRVHSAKVMDRDGIKLLLDPSSADRLPRLSHLWLEAGYNGQEKGADWVQKMMGGQPRSCAIHRSEAGSGGGDEEVGKGVDQRECKARSGEAATRAERSWSLLAEEMDSGAHFLLAFSEQEDEPSDYERLPESAEAFIYVAMSRLMARRLACS